MKPALCPIFSAKFDSGVVPENSFFNVQKGN